MAAITAPTSRCARAPSVGSAVNWVGGDGQRGGAESDLRRDRRSFAAVRLRAAGVPVTTVRYDGIHHDFMMLNPLSNTQATRATVAQAASVLRDALWRVRP